VRRDDPRTRVARLDEIERRDRSIPVREHLGIHAFGVNAFTAGEDGTLVGEHDESGPGQEELYIVLEGSATFEIDGEAVDAPEGTFIFIRPESQRKATGDGTVLVIGATARPGLPGDRLG
jgi:mannose-6-phosphate isomerase-like protein (cupin superfamily)